MDVNIQIVARFSNVNREYRINVRVIDNSYNEETISELLFHILNAENHTLPILEEEV
jgi:hypothetical protein